MNLEMYGMLKPLKSRKGCEEKEQGVGNYRLNHGYQFHMLNHHIDLMDVVFIMFADPACLCEQKYPPLHWSLPISCILLLKPGICSLWMNSIEKDFMCTWSQEHSKNVPMSY